MNAFGQAQYTIPIRVPPGRAGVEPHLALQYNSAGADGYLGVGWSVAGLSAITRCPKTIAQDGTPGSNHYDPSDRFCLDGKRLVLVNNKAYDADQAEYRTEIESFSRIVRSVPTGQPEYFTVWTKSGEILTFGGTVDGNVRGNAPLLYHQVNPVDYITPAPGPNPVVIDTWALTKVQDRVNNTMSITYQTLPTAISAAQTGGVIGGQLQEYYPKKIYYTANVGRGADRYVEFKYQERSDHLAGFQAGLRSS